MGACSGVVRSGKLLISAHFRSFLSLRGAGAGMRGSRLHGNDGGVARSGELLILFRFVPFRSPRTLILTWIPAFAGMAGQGAGMRGSRLHGNDGGVARSGELFNSVPFCSISFPPNPHPYLDSSLRWNDGTGGWDARFPSARERWGYGHRVAKLLIRFRLVPFRSIPCRPNLIRAFSPHGEEGTEGTALPLLLVFGHFGHLSHLCRARLFRSAQEWGPPIPWPDMARFGPIHLWPREPGCATLTPAPLPEGEGMDTRSRDARFPPSRERRGHSQQRRM